MRYLPVYLLLINALGLLLMRIDKKNAVHRRWRIPELALLTVAAIGGGLGSLAGMYLFRHKTRKTRFTVGLPILIVLHILLLWKLLIGSLNTPF